jgi:hypothetical protein
MLNSDHTFIYRNDKKEKKLEKIEKKREKLFFCRSIICELIIQHRTFFEKLLQSKRVSISANPVTY